MKLWGEIKTKLLEHKLRLVLAILLIMPLVLSFVVLYQKDNVEESFADAQIIYAKDLPVNTTVTMGHYPGNKSDISWTVLKNEDVDGDGITEPCLVTNLSTSRLCDDTSDDYISTSKIFYPLKSSKDMKLVSGKYSPFQNRWASSYVRETYNSKFIRPKYFLNGSGYRYNDNTGWNVGDFFKDYEWNAFKIVPNRSIISNDQILLKAFDGGSEAHVYDGSSAAAAMQNYDTAYYENSYDKISEMGLYELGLVSWNSQYSFRTSSAVYSYRGIFWRDANASASYSNRFRGHYYYSSNSAYNAEIINNWEGFSYGDESNATGTLVVYLRSDAIVTLNGSSATVHPENYSDSLEYAKAVTCPPNESKTPSTNPLKGITLAGRINNLGNAIITEKGFYIGRNMNDPDDDSVVAVTTTNGNDTISNKAIKIVCNEILEDPNYFEQMVYFPDYFNEFLNGEYVWVRAYVKSQLYPGGPETTDIGIQMRVKATNLDSLPSTITDLTVSGIKHPSDVTGTALSSNVPLESREWIPSIKWGHLDDNENFVEESGNFVSGRDYWAEITLTSKSGSFPNIDAGTKVTNTKLMVLGCTDFKNEKITSGSSTIKLLAYYRAKDKSILQVGNTVQMGKFNGHNLTWRVTSLYDLDNDGVKEAPLLVLDDYLKESGSNNPYKRAFSFNGQRGSYPLAERIANGSNRYAESSIRRWLNARDENITYASTLHCDSQPITDGFLSGSNFTDSEYNSIKWTRIKSLTSYYDGETLYNKGYSTSRHTFNSSVSDMYQNYNSSYYEETTDKVFLLGIDDVLRATSTSGNGFNLDLGTSYWLRDATSEYTDETRAIDSATVCSSAKAITEKAIRPALFLNGNANLVSLGGGAYKIGDGTEKKVRPAEVITKEINYSKRYDSKTYTSNYVTYNPTSTVGGGIIENPDDLWIVDVGYVIYKDDPSKLIITEDAYGNMTVSASKNSAPQSPYLKSTSEFDVKLDFSQYSSYRWYYRAYVTSMVDGKQITRFGNIMSYNGAAINLYNSTPETIKDFEILGCMPRPNENLGSRQDTAYSNEWSYKSITWYADGEKVTSGKWDLSKTYSCDMILEKRQGYAWPDIPENAFYVQNGTATNEACSGTNLKQVTVHITFDKKAFTVGDFNPAMKESSPSQIYLGGSNYYYNSYLNYLWEDIDDDGELEALFIQRDAYALSKTATSNAFSAPDVNTKTGFNPYFASSEYPARWDLSHTRKYLNVRLQNSDGTIVNTETKYQNFMYANSATNKKYNSATTSLFQVDYGIKDHEYNVIKQAPWKFMLGPHEVNDLMMNEEGNGSQLNVNITRTTGSAVYITEPADYYDANINAYFAYSYEKFATVGARELKLSAGRLNQTSGTNYWTRDASVNKNTIRYVIFRTSSPKNLVYEGSGNGILSVKPCFYLEKDTRLDYNTDGSYFGISKDNDILYDYAVAVTGEPIYSKTPSTLDKIMLTGDANNFAYADIKEKGWYIGYNKANNNDSSVIDLDNITTSAKKVVYKRDLNMTDGYYDQLVDLKELFPDYNPGDYIWVRAYVKSDYPGAPKKETYGNRIRVKPEYTNVITQTHIDDLYITGLLNPAHYIGKPIADYPNTIDPSCAWNVSSIRWGRYSEGEFIERTGNFMPDTKYSVEVVLTPKSPYKVSSTINANYFVVNGAEETFNSQITSGASSFTVYATFPNIVLQSAPDAPEVTLEKNGTTLTANWEEPDDNGAEITEYIVQLDDEDAVSVSNSTFTKTYLNVANTAHTVKVKAVNEMGESEEGTASVKPCYSIPGDSPISYWEEDIVTYVDGSETVKAEWDISQNGDNSVKAYLFNTKNSSNSYVSGDMTLVFSGSGANILDFAYAYKSGSSFASKGTAENETFTTSGYDFRTKYNGVGYITPWSWIPNLHIKHVIFADDTAFTNWDMLLCEMDELVDVTFGGESIKSPNSMQGTFRDTSNFQMNFARINTSNVTSMKRIFKGSLKEQIDLSSWSSNSLLNLDEAFANLLGCQSLTFGTSFTGSSLTSASSLFKAGADGSALVKVDLTNAVFGNITDMSFWFSELDSLKSVKFGSSLGTSKVTNMQGMFKGCESLGLEVEGGLAGKTLDLSMFNTKLVTNASSMFEGCESLEKISFGENGTFEKAENISSIFKDMSSLTELNLSKLELDSVTDYSDVFDGCTNLSKIYLPASIKSGVSIDLPSDGFLPYSQSGNIVSDITDTAHLIPKNLVGASGVEASYVKIATVNDLKVNEINNASSDEAIYDIIRSEAFKSLLPDDENKTVFTGSSNDEKKIAANYLFNHIHTSGTHPYSSLEDAYEDILFSITNAETVTYETLEILPGEKGKFKVPSSLVNTNTITATYTDSGGSHSFAVTPGTDYETIVVDPTVTYTITKTLKNSTLFTDPIEIATITFANHLVLEQGDIIFEGGPFTYNGLAQYVTPKCTKYQGAEFVTTYKLKGTTSLIAKSEVIDAGTYVCETTLTGPDFIDGLKTASFEFTIEKDTFSENDKLTLEGYASSVTYKGAAYNNYALTVKLDGTLLDSSNYEITYGENINAGDGTITVSGKKNFTGSKTFTFTINPKDITSDDDIKPENLNDMEWTGSKLIPPLFDVIDEGIMIGTSPKKLTFESEFNISGYGENIAIGDDNGSVTVNGTGNYTGTKTFTFNIVGQIIRDLSKIEVLIDDTGLVYTGNALTPTDKVKVKLNGVELPSTDFEITGWENNVNANVHGGAQKAKVKVKLKGNYSSDIVSKEFTISPKELTASDFIYNGQVITKEVSKKTDYNDQIPQSEINKISVILSGFESVKLNFTNAKFKGINPNDNPKIFGNFAIELSGLSITNKNYKLKDDFTTFNIASSNGLLVDKIKPEFSDDWASIPAGCYKAGDEIFITLKFDKNISKSGDDPVLEFWSTNLSDGKIGTLQSGKYNARAEFVSVNNNEVKFKYVVSDGDFILNGFSFKLSGINNYSSLKDLLGNEIEFSQKEKRMDGVKIVTPDAVFENLINEIQGNDSSSKKKEKILDILLDSDMSDAIFDDPSSGSLKSKIGTGSGNESLKEFVADYLSNITLEGTNKKEELFDEMNKAIELRSAQDEIKTNLDTYPNDKAVIDSQMIKYQKLTPNQKKNFDDTLKEKLDNLYYSNLTDDYKYKDSPQGEVNEIEMYGIVSRTSAGSDPVKLQVDRISDIERINSLQKMIKDNTSSVVDDPSKERIIAPYDIKLVRADDESVLVDIPGEKVLCRIDLPSSYYGKILNIYHKLGDDSLEKVDGKQVQLIDNKTVVYFECESFSPYFMTSDVVSVKASISDDSTSGSVNPNGLITKNYGQSQTFSFARSGETNRVDITLLKFDESSEEFKEVTGLEPINLYKNQSFTLSNITSNMFITFKFTRDDNYRPDDNKKEEEPKGKAITIGPGEFKAYMEGYSDGTFRPQNNLTRAEAATIIARISGSFSDKANYKSYATSFKDIDKNGWYLNYIGFVVSKGYMCGDSKGFRPNDPITRGEFTKLIYKLLENQMKQISISSKFTDVGGKFYQDYSNTLYSASLIKGYGDGTFKGQNAITRSEACSIINSALGRGKNKEATLNAITKSPTYKTFKDLQSFRWYYLDDMIAAVTYWE